MSSSNPFGETLDQAAAAAAGNANPAAKRDPAYADLFGPGMQSLIQGVTPRSNQAPSPTTGYPQGMNAGAILENLPNVDLKTKLQLEYDRGQIVGERNLVPQMLKYHEENAELRAQLKYATLGQEHRGAASRSGLADRVATALLDGMEERGTQLLCVALPIAGAVGLSVLGYSIGGAFGGKPAARLVCSSLGFVAGAWFGWQASPCTSSRG